MRILDAVPKSRRHKATRCRHCEFCQPRGVVCGVARCAEPGRGGLLVMADQMACGSYRPVLVVLEATAPAVASHDGTVVWRPKVAEPTTALGARG